MSTRAEQESLPCATPIHTRDLEKKNASFCCALKTKKGEIVKFITPHTNRNGIIYAAVHKSKGEMEYLVLNYTTETCSQTLPTCTNPHTHISFGCIFLIGAGSGYVCIDTISDKGSSNNRIFFVKEVIPSLACSSLDSPQVGIVV